MTLFEDRLLIELCDINKLLKERNEIEAEKLKLMRKIVGEDSLHTEISVDEERN